MKQKKVHKSNFVMLHSVWSSTTLLTSPGPSLSGIFENSLQKMKLSKGTKAEGTSNYL